MWGAEGQRRLAAATIAVGGVGGIGAVSALMLAKAGVGRLLIADYDQYESANIVEQACATFDTVGEPKTAAVMRELQRHSHAVVVAVQTDLSMYENAIRFATGADILISGVDNATARISLGRAAAALAIPFVVSANIGWGIVHTVYNLPRHYGEIWRDVRDLRWTDDGFPDMADPSTAARVDREWKIWVVAVSRYEREAIARLLADAPSYYWYAASPAYFAASLGVTDAIKHVVGKGLLTAYPDIFYYDLKESRHLTAGELLRRRDRIRDAWSQGTEAVLAAIDGNQG